jgi:hypothetical protein
MPTSEPPFFNISLMRVSFNWSVREAIGASTALYVKLLKKTLNTPMERISEFNA